VDEKPAEVVVTVETTVDLVGCATAASGRGSRSPAVDIRDLPCFGRPARLVWMNAGGAVRSRLRARVDRRIRPRPTSSRAHPSGRSRVPLARWVSCPCPSPSSPVSSGCAGDGDGCGCPPRHPLVDDPKRVGTVRPRIDEDSFLSANPETLDRLRHRHGGSSGQEDGRHGRRERCF